MGELIVMRIQTYIEHNHMSYAEFAKLIPVATTAVYKWCHGQRVPRQAQMARLYEVTNGAVTPNDFLSLGFETQSNHEQMVNGEDA